MATTIPIRRQIRIALFTGAVCCLFASPLFAGPHHWQRWTTGTIVTVQSGKKQFTVQAINSPIPAPIFWNHQTRMWTNPEHETSVHADLLRPGIQAAILVEHIGKKSLARRILVDLGREETTPESRQDKT